jgi:hypothetical protein
MTPGRFPRTARRDAELLVVVAVLAAGRERVAQPEAAFERDRVGDIGKTRGAFVCRHDEISAVVVEHLDSRRMRDAFVS